MNKLFTKTNRLIFIIAGFCLVLICLIWNQLFYQLGVDRRETISTAVQRNSNLAVSLEQYAIRTIKNADAVLQLVKMEYEKKGPGIDFNSILHSGLIDPQYFNGVSIIDANGRQQLSNLGLSADTLLDLSDREHFRFHKTHKDQLYISKPLLARTIGKVAVTLSRRIDNPDGSFNGTVAIQVEPSMFTRFYSKANLGERDIISLIAPDGITYARRTGNKESFGEDIIKSPLFFHVSKKPVDHYFAKDAIRGVPTYFSYRKLENYPMIATVGSAEEDILTDYHARAKWNYIFAIIFTVLLTSFAVLICNVLVSRRRTYRKTREREIRYRSIFENSNDAIIVLMADGSIEAMNKAAFSLFKISRDNQRRNTFDKLFKIAHPAILLSVEEVNKVRSCKEEVLFTRADGTTFTGEIVCSTYHDAEGDNRFIVLIRDVSIRKQMHQRLLKEQKRYQQKLTRQIILAQEREREKIGHELHDNVNQILTTVKLYLEMATNNPDMREKLLPKSVDYVMNCITEIRSLSHELSAPTLGPQSLVDSLKALIETVEFSSKLSIHFIYDNYHTCLSKDQALAIY
ncbi:MAG: PAS domain S-box protein, partial [Chitinophagaceae bacterium]